MSNILFLAFLWIVLAAAGLAVYLIPSIIAFKQGHPWRWWILAANAFCGWTVLGWFVLLILIVVSAKELERRRGEGNSSPLARPTRGFTRASTGKCPNCEDAYLSGKDVCPDCGRALGKSVVTNNRTKILVGGLALIAVIYLIIYLVA